MASTMPEAFQLEEIKPGSFRTRHFPEQEGFHGDIAFGGFALAYGLKAAHRTVREGYRLYSAMGYFFGAASTKTFVDVEVINLRDTRSFATRQISVSQTLGSGKPARKILYMIADFKTAEPSPLLEYSLPPALEYSSPEVSYNHEQTKAHIIKTAPNLPEEILHNFDLAYLPTRKFFDTRAVPETIGAQTLHGLRTDLPTTQDALPMPEKVNANYYRARHPLRDHSDKIAALAFALDGGGAASGAVFSKTDWNDVGAMVSLDFSLRIFNDNFDFQDWQLLELRTPRGTQGLTHSEARMFDPKGALIASLTEQCILRGKPAKSKSQKL